MPPKLPRRSRLFWVVMSILAVAEVLIPLALWHFSRPAARRVESAGAAPLRVAGSLGGQDARGYARALAPRPFRFPADHGPHPEFRNEWWYYTGNLATAGGRRFGFQLTFFRVALAPPAPEESTPPAPVESTPLAPVESTPLAPGGSTPAERSGPAAGRTSAWATRQIYFAHFAVTDVEGGRFHAYERWERQALDLAGARAEPFRVWVGDWSASAAAPGVPGAPRAEGTPPMRLVAAAGEAAAGNRAAIDDGAAVAIDLTVGGSLPPVPEGDHGLSAKSAEAGNASYYYSLPRLAAAGTLRLGGERFAVSGLAWMDREWSTSSLAAGEVGWDWFALQLDDGWELMLYRLRRRVGSGGVTGGAVGADGASLVTLISPDGTTRLLPFAATRFTVSGFWDSPGSHIRYPAAWHLTVPSPAGDAGQAGDLDLEVRPLLAGQELPLSLRYWEGAVAVRGRRGGKPVGGHGYVELTGYGDVAAGAQNAP